MKIILIITLCLAPIFASAQTVDSAAEGELWLETYAGYEVFADVTSGGGSTDWFGRYIQPYRNSSSYSTADGGITLDYRKGIFSLKGRAGAFDISLNSDEPHTNGDQSYSSGFAGGTVGLNFTVIGFDLGFLYFNRLKPYYFPINNSHLQPVGNLRVGHEDFVYATMSFLDGNTLFSEGGIYTMGLGYNIGGTISSMWVGMGGFPQNGEFIIKAVIAPKNWGPVLVTSTHFGFHDSGPIDFGISLGMKFNVL